MLAAVAALVSGLLAWRLGRGAIDLAIAVPSIERALGPVELLGPRLRVVRTPAGGFDLGLGEGGASENPDALRRLLPSRDADAWLRRLDVRDAEILVTDPASGRSGRVVGARMSVEPGDDGLVARFGGDLELADARVPARGEVRYRPEGTIVDLHVGPVTAAAVAALLPEGWRPVVESVTVPVDASVRIELDGGLAPRTVAVVAQGGAGRVAIPGVLPDGIAVSGIGISAGFG